MTGKEVSRYKQAAWWSGTVFRDKKILAIIVKYSGIGAASNNPVKPELLKKAGQRITKEIISLDHIQNGMRETGTVNLLDHMNVHHCLPVHNFQFGSHEEAIAIYNHVWKERITQNQIGDSCWIGCNLRCSKAVDGFKLKTGPLRERVIVDGPEYETAAGFGETVAVLYRNCFRSQFYCDRMGLTLSG